ncbi:ATP-binding protein [Granulosicoccus antarcticus]|nr:ATP-binding protein [Granulosicoccus antarcticus]
MGTYQYSLHQLDEKIERVGQVYKPYIEELLWQLDIENIEYQLQGFIALDSIKYAVVKDSTGRRIEAGETQPDLSVPRIVVPLGYVNHKGDVESIGSLSIHASEEGVWASVRQQVVTLVLIYLAVAFIVSFLVMRQFNLKVLTPMFELVKQLRKPLEDLRDLRLHLKRESVAEDADELDELVGAIHQMRDQILSGREELHKGVSRLAEAAKLAGLGYCTFDANMDHIIDCDQNYADFHGKSIETMRSLQVGEDIEQTMMNAEDTIRSLESRERILTQHRDTQTYRINFPDGQFRHIRQSFLAKFSSQGIKLGIDAVAQDVTDEILKQEILVQTQKNEAVGKLTGGVAHDFNNILAIILGNVEILNERSKDISLQRYAKATLKAVNQGARLTQQLLSFARKQPLSPKVLDVAKRIRDSAMLLQTSVGDSIRLEIIADGGLWRTKVDPVQLEAVVLNLVVNARDAMSEGGYLTLEVSNARLDHEYAKAHTEVQAGNYVCIALTDTGTGMSEEVAKQAIEPFFTTKKVGKGTGLGLSMAFGFAKQSEGHLKIYSELGIGTTIKLYLPREQSEIDVVPPVAVPENSYKLHGLKVFLIEDNEELREMFSEQMMSLGCVVHSAYDEDSVLKLASEVDSIDVILSDIIIPGTKNGRVLVKELRGFYPEATAIYMSGFTENSVVHNGRLDDGIIFLQKPFRLADLERVLAENLPAHVN